MSDYIEPKGSPRGLDTVAFSVVTMGDKAGKEAERLNQAGDFTSSLYLHGLAVQAAEGLAEWANIRIRQEWGLAPKQGRAKQAAQCPRGAFSGNSQSPRGSDIHHGSCLSGGSGHVRR